MHASPFRRKIYEILARICHNFLGEVDLDAMCDELESVAEEELEHRREEWARNVRSGLRRVQRSIAGR